MTRDWNELIDLLESLGDWHINCGIMNGQRAFECWIMASGVEVRGVGYTPLQAVHEALLSLAIRVKDKIEERGFKVVG